MEEEGRSLPPEETRAAFSQRTEAQTNDPFRALIEKLQVQDQNKLKLPEISKVYSMLVDLGSETAGYIPPELHDTIRNVSIGFGFLAYDQFPDGRKGAFLQRLRREQTYHNRDHLALTLEQAEILQRIASAVNIAYDPGEPEDDTKRLFPFADMETRIPDSVHLGEP